MDYIDLRLDLRAINQLNFKSLTSVCSGIAFLAVDTGEIGGFKCDS